MEEEEREGTEVSSHMASYMLERERERERGRRRRRRRRRRRMSKQKHLIFNHEDKGWIVASSDSSSGGFFSLFV